MPSSPKPENIVPANRSPYQVPRLVVLGAMQEATGAVGNVSNMDGGMGMMRRSQ
ncbi:MAG TPA: hypothetical protein VG916_03725 [Gemmatimonadaceae bacterium]|nr:hypothetical protein [Gemmatimonadaceae bacterium]